METLKQMPILVTNEDRDKVGILWNKPAFVRDPTIWTKSPAEKKAIKKAKRSFKSNKRW